MIRLDIFSDPVCPWCLIGKANLDRALEAAPDHPFVIAWHPFQLNPDMPAKGAPLSDYLAAKFGGRDKALAMFQRVEEAARQAGVEIDVASVPFASNTMDAHRMIHWAGIEGRQTAMVSALFRAYWKEQRNIADHDTLADIAAEVGLDRAAMARLLASDADRDDLLARDADARSKGVNAVPTFLIAQQYVVSGAQSPEFWGQVITELTEKAKAAG
jgi:predicted DsbA family dithiol-disulfide isomerase